MTIEQDIVDWAKSRPAWQRDVLVRLCAQDDLDDASIGAIADDLLAGVEPKCLPLSTADIPGSQSANQCVKLGSLKDLVGVNALASGEELSFCEKGITVVYGDNASGKSGYARLLKSIVGARQCDEILTDVFASDPPPEQHAEVSYVVGTKGETASWPSCADPCVQQVRFYDEGCGDAYLTQDSEVGYRPSALSLLDGLIDVCDRTRDVLDGRLRDLDSTSLSLSSVPPKSSAANFLAGLSAKTTAEDVALHCTTPPNAESDLASAIQEEGRLRESDPSKEKTRLSVAATDLESLAEHCREVTAALDPSAVSKFEAAQRNAKGKRKAAKDISVLDFDKEPVHGVGSETWRAMWAAAAAFSRTEAYVDDEFPVTRDGAHCVLCQQELSKSTVERLLRFVSYMKATTQREAEEAECVLKEMVAELEELQVETPELVRKIAAIDKKDASSVALLKDWTKKASARQEAILEWLKDASKKPAAEIGESPEVKLLDDARAVRARVLTIDSTQFADLLRETVQKKEELQGRLALAKQHDDIEKEIARLKQRESVSLCRKMTDTSQITNKCTTLMRTYVTEAVVTRFEDECRDLKLNRITLNDSGGSKGRLRHRPTLCGAVGSARVTEVLSEGEQTALGLAGYFTEAAFDETGSALVLDDPVSSLDHIRRARVAKRLAEFAEKRQVVVFTHDVAFVGSLHKAAAEKNVDFTERSVARRGDTPGVIKAVHPWKARTAKARIGDLRSALVKIKRDRASWDDEKYEDECAEWGGKLSETWEGIIDTEVTGMVFDRGALEVRPRKFRILARITAGDDREFQASYGRCSQWARRHNKSAETSYVAPEPDELQAELDLADAWLKRVAAYAK